MYYNKKKVNLGLRKDIHSWHWAIMNKPLSEDSPLNQQAKERIIRIILRSIVKPTTPRYLISSAIQEGLTWINDLPDVTIDYDESITGETLKEWRHYILSTDFGKLGEYLLSIDELFQKINSWNEDEDEDEDENEDENEDEDEE